MRRRVSGLVLGFVVSACAADRVCPPGSTQECACALGTKGSQACAASGSRWEPCACPSAAGATPATASARTAEAPVPVSAPPPRPAATGTASAELPLGPQPYTITITSANIAPSKPNGLPWDAGDDPPDVVATVSVKGAGTGVVRTSKKDNTTAPFWGESGQLTINRGDRVVVTLVDKDALADDTIATFEIDFSGPGQQRLSDAAHSVNELLLTIDVVE
jgi:C2 domain-containing protein